MYVLGIDVGTTFTAAATHRKGVTEIAALGNVAPVVPTQVFVCEDGKVLVGEAAQRRGQAEPLRLAREFKRRVGDETPIMVGGSPSSAERLISAVLKTVVNAVTKREGGPPVAIAVTHPANWGQFKTDILRQACDLAGLSNVTQVPEPVAAAVHYSSTERLEPGAVVAVYDLGGGTFDAAVLRKTDDGFVTLGEPEGIERLGGIDFDAAVFAHVRDSLGGLVEELDVNDPVARTAIVRLRQDCVAAKEALSFDTDATIPVLLPNVQTQVRLTRSEFESMIRPALLETIQVLRRALTSAEIEASGLAAVLLTGGSSQMPLVADMVSSELDRPVAVDIHPKHAVALGAALVAARRPGMSADATGALLPPPGESPTTTMESMPRTSKAATAATVAMAGAGAGAAAGEPADGTADGSGTLPPGAAAPAATSAAPRKKGRAARGRGENGGEPVRRRRRAPVLIGLVLLAGLAVAAVALAGGGDPPSEVVADDDTTDETTEESTTVPLPNPCGSESARCASIKEITIPDGYHYVVEYETVNFDPLIFVEGEKGTPEDHHVHFFFDTTEPENAGTNGDPPGDWALWDRDSGDGELRFDEYSLDDAGGADQMCIAVADKDHAVETSSGNCVDLPPPPVVRTQPPATVAPRTATTHRATTTTAEEFPTTTDPDPPPLPSSMITVP